MTEKGELAMTLILSFLVLMFVVFGYLLYELAEKIKTLKKLLFCDVLSDIKFLKSEVQDFQMEENYLFDLEKKIKELKEKQEDIQMQLNNLFLKKSTRKKV